MSADPEKDTITAHEVSFDQVPNDIKRQVFNAALYVAWRYGNGEFDVYVDPNTGDMDEIREAFNDLVNAMSATSRYAVRIEMKKEDFSPNRGTGENETSIYHPKKDGKIVRNIH